MLLFAHSSIVLKFPESFFEKPVTSYELVALGSLQSD